MPNPHIVRSQLRMATADCHERVDAAYSRFDLGDRDRYLAFLRAHACVLLPAEDAMDAATLWPAWCARGHLLRADIDALGGAIPHAVTISPLSEPERWGMLYVLEGSRLGGAMLARQVGPDFPRTYLAAGHRGGGWTRFGEAIEQAGSGRGEVWLTEAARGAVQAFAMFEAAAGVVGAAGIEPATPPV